MQVAVPPYLSRDHITVYVDFRPTEAFTWTNSQTISVIAPVNRKVRVVRQTSPGTRLSDYKDGLPLGADPLNIDSLQAFYMAQEALDRAAEALANSTGQPTVGGVELTTQGIKDLLAGQITPSLLELTLRSEIGLITAGPGTVGSPAWLASEEARNRGAAIVAESEARMAALVAEADTRQADIRNERTLWQEADDSLARQITQVTAAIGQNIAALQVEVQARADLEGAVAQAMTQLEARYKADDNIIKGSIVDLTQVVADGDAALAQDLTTVKAQIGGGDNIFPNPFFARGADVAGMSDADILDRTAAGVPAACPQDRVLRHTTRDLAVGQKVSCAPGDVFEVDVWMGIPGPLAGSPNGGMMLYGYDSSDTLIATLLQTPTELNYTGWRRASGSYTIPANVVDIKCVLWVDRAWPPPANPPVYFALPVVRRKAASMAAVETNASAIATRLGGVEANYTIKVQARADGKLVTAGIGLNATASGNAPSQSEIVLLADKLTFVPSMDGLNVTPQPLFVAGVVNGQNTFVMPGQRLGDKMVEARMLVDGGIEARHMKITGGYGASLWMDPNIEDTTAWGYGGHGAGMPNYTFVSDGITGSKTWRAVGSGSSADGIYKVALSAGKRYRISAWVRRSSDCNGLLYLRAIVGPDRSTTVNQVIPGDPTHLTAWTGNVEGVVPPTTWTRYSWEFVPNGNGKYWGPRLILNWTGTAGWMEAQDIRIEEMLDSSLVVQGGISADRIDTRGLTIKDQYGNVLFGSGTGLNWNQLTSVPALETPTGAQTKADAAQAAAATDATYKANQAATTAVWSGVSGAGKPADNATVGATIGTNLGGTFTQASWDTYMTSAFIRTGHIQSLSANKVTVNNGLSDISGNVGLLRTSTSGGRVEIEANRIQVFDGSNALRVRMGYLL